MIGRITDNTASSPKSVFFDSFEKDRWNSFRERLANIPIGSILEDNPGLLLFPNDIHFNQDKIEEQCIFRSLNDNHIKTENILGFIENNGDVLTISSRFYDNKDDFFLHYMLQKVFGLHQMKWEIGSSSSFVWDFLPFLFPVYLHSALSQGIFRKYRDIQYNDSIIHGKIDLSQFINKNIPFSGKISSVNREFSSCNALTLLIRATIEFLSSSSKHSFLLLSDHVIRDDVAKIRAITGEFKKHSLKSILSRNIRPIHHPYFTKYRPLQQLCLQILKRERVSSGDQNNKISGLLFDASWLWEEYLNTILKEIKLVHPKNREQKGCVYLFDNHKFRRYPDFYTERIVFDAKYKNLSVSSGGGIDRNDIHQLITYMFVLDDRIGAFLYPERDPAIEVTSVGTLNGLGRTISAKVYLIPFIVPPRNSFPPGDYTQFCNAMNLQERKFLSRCSALSGQMSIPIP